MGIRRANVGFSGHQRRGSRTRKTADLYQHRKRFALWDKQHQCKVPAGQRLIIEYVSGFVFAPVSSTLTKVVTMAVTDPGLGLNGAGFSRVPRNEGQHDI